MKRLIAWFKALVIPEPIHSDITRTFQNTMDTAVRWDRTAREFRANGWRY